MQWVDHIVFFNRNNRAGYLQHQGGPLSHPLITNASDTVGRRTLSPFLRESPLVEFFNIFFIHIHRNRLIDGQSKVQLSVDEYFQDGQRQTPGTVNHRYAFRVPASTGQTRALTIERITPECRIVDAPKPDTHDTIP